jgi:hypothetical protein
VKRQKKRGSVAGTEGGLPIVLAFPALTGDHLARMATEGVTLIFTDAALDALADAAEAVNGVVENIGARRLQTVLEKVVEDISFTAPDHDGETRHLEGRQVGPLAGGAFRFPFGIAFPDPRAC